MSQTQIIGYDEISAVASDGTIYYRVTNCCQASAKGSMDAIVCRSCYREVDDIIGMAWTDPAELEKWTGIIV